MPKNSIQFQKGFSIPEFMQMYGTFISSSMERWLRLSRLWVLKLL